MRIPSVAWCAAVIVLAGCGEDPMGCDPCRTTAVANVHVTDAAGRPAPRLRLDIFAYLQICGYDFRGVEGGQLTGPDGHRRMLVSSLYSPFTAGCIQVIVSDSTGTQLTQQEFAVQLRFEYPQPRDSVRFDIVLPAGP